MRIEILILLAAGLLMANVYTEGKYMKVLFTWKKYYKMAAIAFGAMMLYILIKKNPFRARQILATTNDYIKYLPIDKNTANMISPILDFTSKQEYSSGKYYGGEDKYNYPVIPIPMPNDNKTVGENRILNSGKKPTKRSVSETKKKYVASSQNWRCGQCQEQLKASFEVDHKIRLEYGGSNHIDNLVALCRGCHGDKTTIENL
jgi:hypothetical protein